MVAPGPRRQRRAHTAGAAAPRQRASPPERERAQGQLARLRRRRAQGALQLVRPPHRRPAQPGRRRSGEAAGGRAAPLHARRRRRAARRGRARVPRPARARPPDAARPATTVRRSGRRCTGATATCSSTSSRTPTRSRSSWRCSSRAAATTRRRGAAAAPPTGARSRPATATCSSWATRSSRSTASAEPTSRCSSQAADRFGAGGRSLSLTTNFRTGETIIDAGQRRPSPSSSASSATVTSPRSRRTRPSSRCGPTPRTGRRWRCSAPRPTADKPNAAEVRRRESADVAAAIARIVDEGWLVDRAPARTGARLAARSRRRHHDPGAHPHVASRPRGRARRGRHLLPGRVGVAGLRQPARPRPAAHAAGDRRPQRRAGHRRRAALAAVRAAATTTCTASAATTGALRPHAGRFRRRCRPATRSLRASPTSATCTRPGAGSRRASWPTRWCASGGCSSWARPRAGPATCGAGCASCSTRPGPGPTPPTARCASTWRGCASRPPRAAGSSEAVLPETDDDAVRIMTVHAAKGLEFPVTIVAGLSTQPQNRRAGAEVVWPPGQECIIRIGQTVRTEAFDAWKPIDEQMSHDERIRLLYVACTRAQDHLVVSLHRKRAPGPRRRRTTDQRRAGGQGPGRPPGGPSDHRRRPDAGPRPPRHRRAGTEGEAATGAVTDRSDEATGAVPGATAGAAEAGAAGEGDDLPPFDEWRRQRDTALAASRRPRTVAATALTAEGTSRRRRRSRSAQAAPRPRPPPVAEGPLRLGHRAGRPRRHADGRPRARRRGSGRGGRRAGRGRGGDRPRGAHRALVDAALASPTVRQAADSPPLARALRRRAAGGRPHARGLRRPALPPTRRAGGRRLQDRAGRPRRRPRPARRPLPRPGRVVRPGGRRRHRRDRSPTWCSCSSRPRGPSTAPCPGSTQAVDEVRRLAAADDDSLVVT